MFICLIFSCWLLSEILFISLLLRLGFFLFQRMHKYGVYKPPTEFVWIPIGILCGVIGSTLSIAGRTGFLSASALAIGKPMKERPQVGIYLYKDTTRPPKPLVHSYIENNHFKIPAGDKSYAINTDYTLKHDITLYGLGPHMHFTGRSMRIEAKYPNGKQETLLSNPEYDYDWTAIYRLKNPKRLPQGTVITLHALYDNSKQNPKNLNPHRDIAYGIKSSDEMNWAMQVYSLEDGK